MKVISHFLIVILRSRFFLSALLAAGSINTASAQCQVAVTPATPSVCSGSALPLSAFAQGITANNNALEFDGTDDYVSVPHSASLDLSTDLTIEAWVYPTRFNHLAGFVSKYNTPAADGYTLRMSNTPPNDGVGAGGQTNVFSSNGVLTLNTWQHVACVWSGGIATIYVNGNQVAQGAALVSSNSNVLTMGVDYLPSARYLQGRLDEVRIWGTALTPGTLLTWQNSVITNTHPNFSDLRAYYQFEEGSGSSTADASGNNNTGTLINGTGWSASSAPVSTPISYIWSPANGLSDPQIANPTASPAATTTYTITASNGSDSCTSTVTVVVNAAPPVPVITQNGTTLSAPVASTYKWLLNGNPIPNQTNQTITITQIGSYTVMVTNSSGCSSTSAPFNISQLANNEQVKAGSFGISPNPCAGKFIIDLPAHLNAPVKIYVYNSLGSIISETWLTGKSKALDISGESAGIYLISIISPEKSFIGKVVLVK